jgi:hypothetical protein
MNRNEMFDQMQAQILREKTRIVIGIIDFAIWAWAVYSLTQII